MRYHSSTMRNAVVSAIFTALLGMPTAALADSIQLHSYDGSLHMTGEFLGYDKTGFTIETPLGALLIASALVTCEGAVCPPVAQVQADLQATGYILPEQTQTAAEILHQKPRFCPHSATPSNLNTNS